MKRRPNSKLQILSYTTRNNAGQPSVQPLLYMSCSSILWIYISYWLHIYLSDLHPTLHHYLKHHQKTMAWRPRSSYRLQVYTATGVCVSSLVFAAFVCLFSCLQCIKVELLLYCSRGFIKSRLPAVNHRLCCLSPPVTKLHIQESRSCNIKYRNEQKLITYGRLLNKLRKPLCSLQYTTKLKQNII